MRLRTLLSLCATAGVAALALPTQGDIARRESNNEMMAVGDPDVDEIGEVEGRGLGSYGAYAEYGSYRDLKCPGLDSQECHSEDDGPTSEPVVVVSTSTSECSSPPPASDVAMPPETYYESTSQSTPCPPSSTPEPSPPPPPPPPPSELDQTVSTPDTSTCTPCTTLCPEVVRGRHPNNLGNRGSHRDSAGNRVFNGALLDHLRSRGYLK